MCPNTYGAFNPSRPNSEQKENIKLNFIFTLLVVLDILDKLTDDSQSICGCLKLNEMHIKLTSLIICLIDDNLINTQSIPPPQRKKKYCI